MGGRRRGDRLVARGIDRADAGEGRLDCDIGRKGRASNQLCARLVSDVKNAVVDERRAFVTRGDRKGRVGDRSAVIVDRAHVRVDVRAAPPKPVVGQNSRLRIQKPPPGFVSMAGQRARTKSGRARANPSFV